MHRRMGSQTRSDGTDWFVQPLRWDDSQLVSVLSELSVLLLPSAMPIVRSMRQLLCRVRGDVELLHAVSAPKNPLAGKWLRFDNGWSGLKRAPRR